MVDIVIKEEYITVSLSDYTCNLYFPYNDVKSNIKNHFQ